MTEDEAKTKWCPFARASEGALAAGRLIELKCVGSRCMAWRWVRDGEYRIVADAEFKRTGRHTQPTDGHCGLAGASS